MEETELLRTFKGLKAPANECPFPKTTPCSPYEIYKRIDGSCTNLRFPYWFVTKDFFHPGINKIFFLKG
jgi:hypothetical protein